MRSVTVHSYEALEQEIAHLKGRLDEVVALHGPRDAEVDSIMDRLDPLIAKIMAMRLKQTA